jgi:hypothetical protein
MRDSRSGEKYKSDSDVSVPKIPPLPPLHPSRQVTGHSEKTHPSRQVTGHTQDGTIGEPTVSAMNPPGSPSHGAKAAPKVAESLDHQGKLRKKKRV